MNTAYQQAANNAAELERAYKYAQAKLMWLTAEQYAHRKYKNYCNIRAEFCWKFGARLEAWNG